MGELATTVLSGETSAVPISSVPYLSAMGTVYGLLLIENMWR